MISLCRLVTSIDGYKPNVLITRKADMVGNGDWTIAFLKHLICSGNIEEKTDGTFCLFRPLDCAYAESWVMFSSFVPNACKPSLRHIIRRIEKAPDLWFNIKLSERSKCDSIKV